MSSTNFRVVFREDGSATVFARVACAGLGGAATGVAGEGNWALRADVSSFSYRVWDETNNEEVTASTSLNTADVLVDTPVTSTANWPVDAIGYNFTHTLAPANFPQGGVTYAVEYTTNFASGAVGKDVVVGQATAIRGS